MAKLFNAERKIGADLEVVKADGWRRTLLFDKTGLTWINPSPNMRSLSAAVLYPGIGILETTNLSVGRGTERPFEWIGAPWLDGPILAHALADEKLPGIRFVPVKLTPAASVHKGKECGGVHLFIDDWSTFQPVRTGLAIAATLRRLYPEHWKTERLDILLVHQATWKGLVQGAAWRDLEEDWQPALRRYLERRKEHLLYDE
jgi:uncharacterized protein YbbC (DUF1343 family)